MNKAEVNLGTLPVGVRAQHITASYREMLRRKVVLHDISCDVSPAEVTAIVGPNGSGKTTFLSVVMGFLRPDNGTCTIDGMDSARYRITRGIAYLPETTTFPAGWNVRQILARAADLACRHGDRDDAFRKAIRRAALDDEVLTKHARACSKGMQRRIAFAWAVVGDPPLVVVDEPFSGLDPRARVRMRHQLRSTGDRGTTVLMASHDLAEVESLADNVFVMQDGKLWSTGHLRSDGRSFAAALEAEFFTPQTVGSDGENRGGAAPLPRR